MDGESNSTKEKVMVVDDEPQILFMIKRIFAKDGYDVLTANGGKECLEILESEKPDIILLDLMMPDMDGYAVCENVKSNAKTKDIPVVFVSVKNGEMNIIKAIELGASDYLTKPITNQLLLTKVKKIIRESKNKIKMYTEFEDLQKKVGDIEGKYRDIEVELGGMESKKLDNPVLKETKITNSVNESALIEHTPRDDYMSVINSISKNLLDEGKTVVMLTSQPYTKRVKETFLSEIEGGRLKLIDIVTSNVHEDENENIIQLNLSEVVHYGAVWNALPKNSILLFTQLSDILVKFGVNTTYHFIKNASEKIEERNVSLIVTINKVAHEENVLSGIETLFSTVYEIRDDELKKVVY